MDIAKLTSGQRICASILVVMLGIAFSLPAVLAGLAAMVCCKSVFGYFSLKSGIYRNATGVITGGIFFLVIVLLLRWDKRRDFISRSSVAIVERFSRRHDHDA
jgi:hypothetical protein